MKKLLNSLEKIRSREISNWPCGHIWNTDLCRYIVLSDTDLVVENAAVYLIASGGSSEDTEIVISVSEPRLYEQLAGLEYPSQIDVKSDIVFDATELGGWRMFRSETQQDQHFVARSGNHTIIVSPETSSSTARYPVRIVRELMLRKVQSENGLFAHAAMASSNGSGVLITGDSGRGKSTIAWALLCSGYFENISSDRTLLMRAKDDNAVTGIGWPLATRLGRGLVQSPNFNSHMCSATIRMRIFGRDGLDVVGFLFRDQGFCVF